jgi:hypothetical protein
MSAQTNQRSSISRISYWFVDTLDGSQMFQTMIHLVNKFACRGRLNLRAHLARNAILTTERQQYLWENHWWLKR